MHIHGGSRRRIFCFAMVAVGLAIAFGWFARTRVPEYQGHDVYYWMFQTKTSSLKDNPGLSAIGTNAVPYLAQALAMRETPYDRYSWVRGKWGQFLLVKISGFTWSRSGIDVRFSAAYSLLAFGTDARPALAELHSAVTDPTLADGSRQTVVHVLSELGPPPESLPWLVEAWSSTTNSTPRTMQDLLRRELVGIIGRLAATNPDCCLPILLSELNSGDEDLQSTSVWGIGSIGLTAHAAVLPLEKALGSTNTYLQFAAAVTIGRVTNGLPSLVPRVQEMASSMNDRRAAAAAMTLWRWQESPGESVRVLTNLLSQTDCKGIAADYLGAMGLDALPALPALLEASQHDIGAWVDRYSV